MEWKKYENNIFEHFKGLFPHANIFLNAKIKGRYSNVMRQIDILIEDYVAGAKIRYIIDGKYFSKKIDVKCVEMFIGMLNDCEANKGLIITSVGFSTAAINRANNDPFDLEFDILNYKDLAQFQSEGAIPYSGNHGVIISAPLGWVVDATRTSGWLASLYQRGYSRTEDAAKNKEFMYINIRSKDELIKSLDDFIIFQNDLVLKEFPSAMITLTTTIKNEKANTKLRVIKISKYPTTEYTGFVEFKEFIFFCVLFTTEEHKNKNIRKLEHVISRVVPLNVKHS